MRYIKRRESGDSEPIPLNELIDQNLSSDLQENLANLDRLLEGCSDVVIKEFEFAKEPTIKAGLLYFDGLVQRSAIEDHILKPLMLEIEKISPEFLSIYEAQDMLNSVQNRILSTVDLDTINTFDEVCHHISSGDTVLIIDGYTPALVADTRMWETRAVETPENEIVIFGPKEGFNETLRINTAALRRRIKSTNFKIESFVIGRITKTDVVLCYINNIAPEGLVNEVRKRLNNIDIDAVLDTGYLKEFIADNTSTMFSEIEHTEKPDRVCGHLLEGRVCIMVDGSPMAIVTPISFPQYLISSEDYYTHYVPASLFRILRAGALFMSLLLPSIYVALITFHHEMIPTSLYLTILATRQGVPFPPFLEALILEATFEMLREAGIRLPRAVGPAVSIVGALIIGDAAVRAGLVSTPMVVIVAFTGIASFVMPAYNAGIIIRISRFGFLFSGAILGFLGIMVALGLFLTRMVSLTSLGQPYMAPIAPFNRAQMTDILIRRPWFKSEKRPYFEGMDNQIRQNPPDKDKDDGGS